MNTVHNNTQHFRNTKLKEQLEFIHKFERKKNLLDSVKKCHIQT